jgi:hypothetical protein
MGQTSRTAGDGAVVDLVMQRVVGAKRRRDTITYRGQGAGLLVVELTW